MNKNYGRAWPWIFLYLSIFLWMALLYPVATTVRHPGPSPLPGIILFASVPAIIGGFLIVSGIMRFKARRFGLLIGLLIWIFTGYLVGIILQNISDIEARGRDLLNIKNLGLALMMYAEDYDGYLPQGGNWVDATYPYDAKDWKIFQCPADKSLSRSSYAFNANLGGKKLEDIKNPNTIILAYETNNPGDNPVGIGKDFPPRERHKSLAQYGGVAVFADGHPKLIALKDLTGAQSAPHW
jgi:hypothetical protein